MFVWFVVVDVDLPHPVIMRRNIREKDRGQRMVDILGMVGCGEFLRMAYSAETNVIFVASYLVFTGGTRQGVPPHM